MAADKLGKYILDHDDVTYYIDGNTAKKIEYSSDKILIGDQDKSEILERDHHNYIDFKFSFDELNFDNKDQAIEKLDNLVKDISKIEINNPKKSTWIKQFNLPEEFVLMNDIERKKYINEIVNDHFNDDVNNIPEIVNYKIDNNKKGNQVLKVKLRRTYDRKISLDDSLISIHTKAGNDNNFEGYNIKPHIHIVIDKNKALGKDFSKLRKELYTLFKEHELTSSHNTYIDRDRNSEEYKEYQILKDRLTSFSWVLNKHEEEEYILKQLKQYDRNPNCVKLDNVEEKINRYLELEGSFDFARKIKINLKEKLNIDIKIKAPESYIKADRNIGIEDYESIINDVRYNVLNGLKISERYKEFAIETLKKDQVDIQALAAARAIKEVIKNRGFYYDQNYNKVIDKDKINNICDRNLRKIFQIDHHEIQTQILNKIKNRVYLDQETLRYDLMKAEIRDIKEVIGVSEVKIVFEGVEKYIKNNLIYKDYERESITDYQYVKKRFISDDKLKEMDIQLYDTDIKEWFIDKYPEAIDVLNITNEKFGKMQITKQTEDAYLINDEVWLGKSPIENMKIFDIEEQTITKETVTISASMLPIEMYEDIREQIKVIGLNITDNWVNQIASKIYIEKNINWVNINDLSDVNNQVNIMQLNYLDIAEEQINNISKSIYYGKYAQVKELVKENLDYTTIKPSKAQNMIKKQMEGLDLDISDTWKDKIARNIYFEDGFAEKHWKEIRENYDRINTLKAGYNSVKDSYQELNKKLKDVSGESRDTVSVEINNIQNETKNILSLLRQLEINLITISNSLDTKEKVTAIQINTNEIDDLLNSYEELLVNYQDKIKSLDNQIEQLSNKEIGEPSEEKIAALEEEIENLNSEEYELVKTSQDLSKAENKILEGYTLQHFETELTEAQNMLKSLNKELSEEKDKKILSRLFNKQNLSDLEKRIEAEQLIINTYIEKIEKVKSIRTDRARLNEMTVKINKVKKHKINELKQLKEMFNSIEKKKDKNKSLEWDSR